MFYFSHNMGEENFFSSDLQEISPRCWELKLMTTTVILLTFGHVKRLLSWIKKKNPKYLLHIEAPTWDFDLLPSNSLSIIGKLQLEYEVVDFERC